MMWRLNYGSGLQPSNLFSTITWAFGPQKQILYTDSSFALVRVAVVVGVAAGAVPSVTDTVRIATVGDVNAANNLAAVTTTVNGVVDLALAKSHAGVFTVGQPGVYTLVVSNVGSAATTGAITIADTLPVGLRARQVAVQ